ncbi:MAG: type II secretion system F family protein [Patescibacteria group bacterium]
MSSYHYHARAKDGEIQKGIIEAPTEDVAAGILRDRGMEVIEIEEEKGKGFSLEFLEHISVRDFVVFARQLSVLIGAKVPLVQSLRTASRQTTHRRFQTILTAVADDVESGTKLSTALSRYPTPFDDFFINMVRSGETSGRLDEVLNYLADQKEKDYDLISKIRGAMIYPAFIIVGMFAVGIVMMVFVIPQLTGVLQESGAALPWTTRLLIGTSGFMQKYWLLVILLMLGSLVAFRSLLARSHEFRSGWDQVKVRLPLVGGILQKIYLVRFTRSMETLMAGGVDVVGSLRVAADVVGNAAYRDLLLATVKEVEDGNSMTSVLSKSALVPNMIHQMLSVGEETGRLKEILGKLTLFYAREVDNSVGNLVAVIEPLIMIVIGAAVGVIVSAIILPMYQLASQF